MIGARSRLVDRSLRCYWGSSSPRMRRWLGEAVGQAAILAGHGNANPCWQPARIGYTIRAAWVTPASTRIPNSHWTGGAARLKT